MNNSTLDQSGISPWQPLTASLYIYVISVLVSGWTVGANAVILAYFYRNRHKQLSSFSRMIISMTVSDLLVGLVWTIYLGVNRNKGQMMGLICSTAAYLSGSLQCVSLYHVLGICVLRNKVLQEKTSPGLKAQQNRWTIVIIIISWILPMVVLAIPGVIWASFSVDEIICRLDVVFGDNLKIATSFMSMFYLTSQVLTDILYCITVIKLKLELRKNRVSAEPAVSMNVATEEVTLENTNGTTGISDAAQRRMMKYHSDITSTIGLLLILFNILTLPQTIGLFFVGRVVTPKPNIIFLTNSLFVLNSGINPIVYAIRIPMIKDSLRLIAVEVTKCLPFQR